MTQKLMRPVESSLHGLSVPSERLSVARYSIADPGLIELCDLGNLFKARDV
jgi:hypothetical protein